MSTDSVEELKAEIARLRGALAERAEPGSNVDPAFASMAQALSDNVMLLDAEGCIRYINWTVPDLTPEQVVGTSVTEYLQGRSRDNMLRALERIRVSRRPDRYETAYVASDGQVSYWESRVGPVLAGATITGFSVVSSIVSERRDAAADRDRLFDLCLDALAIVSSEGVLMHFNPALEHILGFSQSELTGQPIFDFVHEDDRAIAAEMMGRLAGGGRVTDFECRVRTKAGGYRWLSWCSVGDPERHSIYGAGRDVTETKALQAQVQQAQKMDAVGKLAGGVAHDFNNLLLTISANAGLARRARTAEAAAEHLGEIEQAVKRAAALTKQLLAFGRQQSSARETLDLNLVARELVNLLRRLIPTTIEIELNEGRDLSLVHADRTQLDQVLVNLCLNARDAMPDGGRITLATRDLPSATGSAARGLSAAKRYVAITVSDTGHGMTPEVRERAFEPFFTTKEQGKGTGLGLSTVYGIVRQHDGVVQLESAPGKGTSFTVWLPVGEQPSAPVVVVPVSAVRGGSETILVAEDEEAVRRVVSRTLQDAGYHVLTASDGIEAVSTYEQHAGSIALVLLDVVMPRAGGVDAHAALRERNPSVPLLFTSGYNESEQLSRVLASDPASFGLVLPKPYDRDTLLRTVRSALDAAAPRPRASAAPKKT